MILLEPENLESALNHRLRDHQCRLRDHQYGCRGGNRYEKGGIRNFDKKSHLLTDNAIN